MRGLNNIVFRLSTIRVPRQPALLAQGVKGVTTGHQLVYIGLMPCIKENRIVGRIKNTVDTKSQLNNAKIGA